MVPHASTYASTLTRDIVAIVESRRGLPLFACHALLHGLAAEEGLLRRDRLRHRAPLDVRAEACVALHAAAERHVGRDRRIVIALLTAERAAQPISETIKCVAATLGEQRQEPRTPTAAAAIPLRRGEGLGEQRLQQSHVRADPD